MSAIPEFQKQMLTSSDYERDLVIWANSGTITLDNTGSGSALIPHGLPFIPLARAVFSRTPNFNNSLPNGYIEEQEQYLTLSLSATSNTTTVDLSVLGEPGEVWYYRAFGLMPSGASGAVTPTAGLASKFLYNSDNRYTKVFKRGKVTQPTTISHNLGWIPQVECWWEISPGVFDNSMGMGSLDGASGTPVMVTPTGLIIDTIGTASIEYRIYLDDY